MKSPIYKQDARRIQKEILGHLRFNIILFFVPTVIATIGIFIFDFFGLDRYIPLLFITTFVLVSPVIIIAGYVQWISGVIQYTLVKAKIDLGTLDRIDSIDEILSKTSVIRKTISILRLSIATVGFFLKESGKDFLKGKIDQELKYFLQFLLNLKSDLTIRLTEQQQSLESAKLEVESNIKGTNELNKVSELQRIRLDKQIEQFEELQRVLVKV